MAIGDPYATLAELKGYLGIGIADTVDDTQLSAAVVTASRDLEHYCRRQFNRTETATARVFTPRDACLVRVHDFYTNTDLAVSVDVAHDETFSTSLTVGQYFLRPHDGVVDGQEGWPYTSLVSAYGSFFVGLVQVTARWGWEEVPEPVHQACLMLASELFKSKDAPWGVAGFGEFGPIRVRRNPLACALLEPYRRSPVLVG